MCRHHISSCLAPILPLRETLNLLICADSSTKYRNKQIGFCKDTKNQKCFKDKLKIIEMAKKNVQRYANINKMLFDQKLPVHKKRCFLDGPDIHTHTETNHGHCNLETKLQWSDSVIKKKMSLVSNLSQKTEIYINGSHHQPLFVSNNFIFIFMIGNEVRAILSWEAGKGKDLSNDWI